MINEAATKAVTEQVFEARHAATGTFLDFRGRIADAVKRSGTFSFWRIDNNVVLFSDAEEREKEREGAFVGYKSLGFFASNPSPHNYFVERAAKFYKTVRDVRDYPIPEIVRVGMRTKWFLAVSDTFESLAAQLYDKTYSESFRKIVIGRNYDMQIVVEGHDNECDIRLTGGPMKPGEAEKHFRHPNVSFDKVGLMIDIDYFRLVSDGGEALKPDDVVRLLKSAQERTFTQIDIVRSALVSR